MKWLQLPGLTDKQQLTFLPGDSSSGHKPAFCFPGEYPADVLSVLTEIGFTPVFEGLTAPLTYEIADRLRKLEGAVVVDLDEKQAEYASETAIPQVHPGEPVPDETVVLPPLSNFSTPDEIKNYLKIAHGDALAVDVPYAIQLTDGRKFAAKVSHSGNLTIYIPSFTTLMADGKVHTVLGAWRLRRERRGAWAQSTRLLPVSQDQKLSEDILHLARANGVQVPELPAMPLAALASQPAESKADPTQEIKVSPEPSSKPAGEQVTEALAQNPVETINPQRSQHATGRSESAGFSVVGDAPDLSDGQPAPDGAGTVSGNERQTADAASGLHDSAGPEEGERASGDAEAAVGGDAAADDVPPRRSQSRSRAPLGSRQAEDLGLGRSASGSAGAHDAVELQAEVESGPRNARNYRIMDDEDLTVGGLATKAAANIAALRLLKELQQGNREPTVDEKRVLNRFSGWGSLAQEVFRPVFDQNARREARFGNESWYRRDTEGEGYEKWREAYGLALHPSLGGLMTEEEWKAAKDATLNSHYTSPEVIRAMWNMVERLGFRGGRILEPSAGTGLFLGLMPETLASRSDLVGVELDKTTGGILEKLYPDADIQVTGFEDAKRLASNSADLVISNVPFGNYQVVDNKRPEYADQSIHNYFISRSLDTARPGGLVAAITTHFSLDAVSNAKLRASWAEKADMVAAVRLPNTAFRKSAGTEVTTDILLFRKKSARPSVSNEPFRHSVPMDTLNGAHINEYFVRHPEMILGHHAVTSGMYGDDEYTLEPSGDETLVAGLQRVIELLPTSVLEASAPVQDLEVHLAAGAADREGSLVLHEGLVYAVQNGELVRPEWGNSDKKNEQAAAYIGLKNALSELILTMNTEEGDENVTRLQRELNTLYDGYVERYGPVTPNRRNRFLTDDLEYPNIAALENTTTREVEKIIEEGPQKGETRKILEKQIEKADIFSKRTIFPFCLPTEADSLEDAVKISRVYLNCIDVPYIAKLTRTSEERAREGLLESGNVFVDPETGILEARDVYLAGNVRSKLALAQKMAEEDPSYQSNVTALTEIQPPKKLIDQISVKLGTSWMPERVVTAFLQQMGVNSPSVQCARVGSEDGFTVWQVSGIGLSPEARNRWSVEGADLLNLVQDSLNLKRTRILVEVETLEGKKTEEDKEKSLAAQEKQREIQEAFRDFVKNTEAAATLVEDIYNDKFNGHVVRCFEAPDMQYFPGASRAVELRPNQKIAVTRALQESTLLAHGVGTGKTFEQITLAMEMRRLGTAKKPWIVVQGATVSQFAAAFKQLYPSAKILVPSEQQRTAANRQRLLSQIATGDWDAVITPHSFFNSVSISPETEEAYINEEIAELEEMLVRENQKASSRDQKKLTTKIVRRKLKSLENRLEKLANTKKDENIFFEHLGIDALLIDEAHAYKRGAFFTKMDAVKGLDRDSSQRSMQLLMKARHVQAKTGGKNVVLATGTPISNTLTELWTMFRYIRPDLLESFHVTQFDDFASTFAETSVSLEETATGDFRMVERFNTYVNGQALLTMWRCGADVALAENLDYLKGLPKLEGGKIHEIAVERSNALSNYIRALKMERDRWDKLPPREKMAHPSVPLEIYGKAKRAAIDLRLVLPDLPDEGDSKANRAVANILRTWEEQSDTRAVQLVFCDSFQSSDKKFNLFKEIAKKLVAGGVPHEQIAIIHDFQTDKARSELFEQANRGDVRILLGTTERLGVGVNIQERLHTLHHLDAPMRPMDFEQRNGRIRRAGNMHPEIRILTYGTKNTLDSVIFQQLISKQKFINQVLRGDIGDDTFENPFDDVQASFEDMMAAFSGNPLAKDKMKLQVEVRRLQSLKSAYESRMAQLRLQLRSRTSELERKKVQLDIIRTRSEHIAKAYPEDKLPERKATAEKLSTWLSLADSHIKPQLEAIRHQSDWIVADKKPLSRAATLTLNGELNLRITAEGQVWFEGGEVSRDVVTKFTVEGPHEFAFSSEFSGSSGLITRLENALKAERLSPEKVQNTIKGLAADIVSLKEELTKAFPQSGELEATKTRLVEVETALADSINADTSGPTGESIKHPTYEALDELVLAECADRGSQEQEQEDGESLCVCM